MREKPLSNQTLMDLCGGLALLLHAGVGTADGLDLLGQQQEEPALAKLLTDLARRVDDGASLAQALEDSGRFPHYLCALIEVGEAAGRTEEALAALERHYESRMSLDRRLRSALLYPCILMLIMLGVIVVLLTKVLPVFDQVYAGLGGSLTGVAGGLLALGRVLDGGMPVLCALLGAAGIFLVLFSLSEGFRQRLVSGWRRRFGDRGVSRKIDDGRFAQALSMGMASGLPLEDALTQAAGLLEDSPSAQARCRDCLERLDRGEELAQAVRQSEVLPPAECRLLALGLRSGSGDRVMEDIARRLGQAGEDALEDRVSQVEPALVGVTSVLVGIILLSVMLPLMHIMSAIG